MLIRHGESEGNCDKTVNCYTPNHKVPLTAIGREQAYKSGIKLHDIVKNNESICFYTSPYLRTRQTLQGILKGFKEKDDGTTNREIIIHEEPRMREQDFGNFQGTPQEMKDIWIERAKYGHFFYRIPHGESAADVFDRCSSFNDTLFRQFSKDDFPDILVLVTHGIWARVFLQRWFRWSVEYFESLKNIPHCDWIILQSHEPGEDPTKVKNDGERTYTLETVLDSWNNDGARDIVYPY